MDFLHPAVGTRDLRVKVKLFRCIGGCDQRSASEKPKLGRKESEAVDTRDLVETCRPWKINGWKLQITSNQPFRKENDLPNLHDCVKCYTP